MNTPDIPSVPPAGGRLSYSPDEQAAAYRQFVADHPGYARTDHLTEMRDRDYARLDRLGHVYLDYTGGGL